MATLVTAPAIVPAILSELSSLGLLGTWDVVMVVIEAVGAGCQVVMGAWYSFVNWVSGTWYSDAWGPGT